MENGETKDDLKMPTSVKIGEPTEEDEKCAAEALTAVDNGKGPLQNGQVHHIRLAQQGDSLELTQGGQRW